MHPPMSLSYTLTTEFVTNKGMTSGKQHIYINVKAFQAAVPMTAAKTAAVCRTAGTAVLIIEA